MGAGYYRAKAAEATRKARADLFNSQTYREIACCYERLAAGCDEQNSCSAGNNAVLITRTEGVERNFVGLMIAFLCDQFLSKQTVTSLGPRLTRRCHEIFRRSQVRRPPSSAVFPFGTATNRQAGRFAGGIL